MTGTVCRERRLPSAAVLLGRGGGRRGSSPLLGSRARSALDDATRRRSTWLRRARELHLSPSKEEERIWNARPGASDKAQTK